MKNTIREILITIALAIVIYLILQTINQTSVVNQTSMLPGLEEGQRLFVVKILYKFKEPARGDIIVIRPPIDPEKEYVKRLIGLPGDTIEIRGGKVYLNGVLLNEPYIKEPVRYTFGPYTVPDGQYFVLGDKRNVSNDSHNGWTVSRREIIGKVWWRYWPLNKFGLVGNFPLDRELEAASRQEETVS